MNDTFGFICFIISMSFATAGFVAIDKSLKYASAVVRYPIEIIGVAAILFTMYWVVDTLVKNHNQ